MSILKLWRRLWQEEAEDQKTEKKIDPKQGSRKGWIDWFLGAQKPSSGRTTRTRSPRERRLRRSANKHRAINRSR